MRYETLVGLRYTRAKRRNRVGVNSLVSIIGIALGVAVLIVVLSVVNGFQEEVRTRILGFAAHVQISAAGRQIPDWRAIARIAAEHPRVVAAAPFVDAPAMLFAGEAVRGALLRGVEPQAEERVADFARYMRSGSLDALKPGEYGVVLGADLARNLGAAPGDKVALVAPQGQAAQGDADGISPRLAQLTVVGVFEAGFQEADALLGVVHLADAQALYRMGSAVSGVRLKLDDAFVARQVSRELLERLPPEAYVTDWTRLNANFFHAVEITKRLMFVILVLIVLVAAINVVSTLVVMVTGKQGDIAILRSMGASPREVMRVFIVHGMALGLAGTLAGVALGCAIALNIDLIVPAVERLFSVKFINKEVYLIDALPSALRALDVAVIAATALALSILATLYPSWRAARTAPADALRYELMVGLRYTRAGRRNRFVGVNSAVSMVGICLGVWALIVVMSVMNGLQTEIRTRILGVYAHVQIVGPAGRLADWRAAAQAAATQPHVLALAPFVEAQSMLSAGRAVRPAMVRGIVPAEEAKVADLARHMRAGLDSLRPGEFQVVLGADLARSLGVVPGDKVALIAPQGMVTPAGVIPRLKQFTVAGTFHAGVNEADGRLALIHLADAQTLYRYGDSVSGVRLKLDDLFAARGVARELALKLPPGASALDWTRVNSAFFNAVELEKRVMFVILALIVLVAAINIISTLVVAVADRQSDIAILRTVGAAPGSIVRIFMVQGIVIGVIGTAAGLAAGILTALNIDVIVPAIENAFRFKIFAKDVYLIPDLPSELQAGDVAAVTLMALLLSFLAAIYPSWRAARVNPAEALRYE